MLAVLLVCYFSLFFKTTDMTSSVAIRALNIPAVHLTDRCRVHLQLKGRPGHRSHRLTLGGSSDTEWVTQAPAAGGLWLSPSSSFLQILSGGHCGSMSSVCPSSCLQGCVVQSCASWKRVSQLVQMLICTLIHLLCLSPCFQGQMNVPFQL